VKDIHDQYKGWWQQRVELRVGDEVVSTDRCRTGHQLTITFSSRTNPIRFKSRGGRQGC
jgi:hypothetical protein